MVKRKTLAAKVAPRKARPKTIAGEQWRKVTVPTVWQPTPGDTITGVFLGIQEKGGQYGQYRVFVLETDDGVVKMTGSLLIALAEAVMPGQIVRVVYCGTEEMASGYMCKNYELYVRA